MEFRDLKAQYQINKHEIDDAMQEVLNNADFISGKQVDELEGRLAEYIGTRYCITCANGTDAMTLVMMAWEIQKGDAVFIPDFTFFSTGEIVALRGATPIFVDVDRDTFNMDSKMLEKAIVRIIKEGQLVPRVIIPVDLFGLPANYSEIVEIAERYNLLILEDGAQGFGGSIQGKRACSFGDVATTSFFPAKPLGCYGDGGAIFTDDEELAQLINSYKIHGKGDNKYDNIRIGINSRLDTIQAAVLNVKLKVFMEHELEDVNRIYHKYNEKLRDVVEIPIVPEGYLSSFAQYTIKLKDKWERDNLQAGLKEQGIPSMVYYKKPMHKQIAFSELKCDENDFKVSDELCDIVLSLPMHPYMSEEDVERVCNAIKGIQTSKKVDFILN